MANSVDPDQTAPIGAVCSGSTLFASMLNSSVVLGNYLQQMTSADNIFRHIFSWRFKGYFSFYPKLNTPSYTEFHLGWFLSIFKIRAILISSMSCVFQLSTFTSKATTVLDEVIKPFFHAKLRAFFVINR